MIFDYYRKNADFLICQETHSEVANEQIWAKEWGGGAIFGHGTTAARGIAIFYDKKYKKCIENVYKSEDGRMIVIDVKIEEEIITIVGIYAPNQDSPVFFKDLAQLLRNRQEHKIIIGDFNLTLQVELDRQNTYNNNNKAKDELVNIMDEFYLHDVWRVQHPEKREYSWMKPGHIQKASRIDYALVTAGLDQKAKAVQYIPGIKTDHRAFYICLDLIQFERGVGYWKFNSSLLKNKEFLIHMNKELNTTIQASIEQNPIQRWETLKRRIKKISSNFARKKASENGLIISQLSEKVDEYECSLPLNKDEDELLAETKKELEEKLYERVKGLIFRSKVRWLEEGEKNTKYFFALEKARYNAKTCYKILDENDMELVNPQDILQYQKQYYQNLYQEDKDVRFTLENTYGIRVPDEIRQSQNCQITDKEIEQAMLEMNNNKTPGQDGIPVDFYKVFWMYLKEPFMSMMLYGYQQQELHETARKGILNLIPKPNKDAKLIKNLRPITLLNVDYKIIEKAVANKMLPALEKIINKDQRGFMKDRRISVNIRKMLDIIHHTKQEDMEAVILSLDFVKCFDKCSFTILHGSLDFFGFGQIVKDWTRILYNNFTVTIQNNGYFSTPIGIHKGVHQGGCCSSVYFLVIAEILAISLRNNQDIEGITIQDIKNLLNQFADDMDIFSMSKEKSLQGIFSELESFRLQSGFTVSYEKTTLYRIGSLRHSDAKLYDMAQFAWSNKDINVLGVQIAHEDLIEKNYNPLVEKTKQILEAWYNRGLTLLGKVQVVNTLVASLYVYKMLALPFVPHNIIKRIDNVIREFLWNGKKAKIACSILQNPKDQGGVSLVQIRIKDLSLKATWPVILHSEPEYEQVVYKIMRMKDLQSNIWRCTLCHEDVDKLKVKSEFWRDVLYSWANYNFSHNFRIDNQIIWYNSHIRIENSPFFWRDVYQRGLVYVYQLFENKEYKPDVVVQTQFGLTKMRYNSLKKSIPREWKDYFMEQQQQTFLPVAPHNYDMCMYQKGKGLASKIYKYLEGDITLLHNKYNKWLMELGHDIAPSIFDYGKLHQDIYKTTNIVKYRSFQYRFLQRGIITNIQLHEWGIKDDAQCYYCQSSRETLLHLFFYCDKVQELWTDVELYIEQRFKVKVKINQQNMVTNRVVQKISSVINLICLITKQYIYRQRCMGGSLNFPMLKNQINMIENLEKYVATKNDKLLKHEAKWKCVEVTNVQSANNRSMSLENYIQQYQESITL